MKKLFFFMFVSFSANVTQAQWWPDVRVTSDPYNSYASLRRSVGASNETVHVVWCDESMENPTIHYVRSIDAGLNWDTELQLTSGEFYDDQPSVAVSGTNVHVVWFNTDSWYSDVNEIFYMRSTNGGEDWESAVQLTSIGDWKWHPAIAVSGNYIHVTWYGSCEDQWEIYYLRSADSGETWDDPVRMTFDPEISAFSTLAADGPILHLVWHDWRHGDPEIYYKRSDDNGTTWGEDIRMTNCDGKSRFAEIAASGSFVQIVFQDNRDGDYEIYSFTSLDGGLTWGPETRLTYESSASEHPFVAITGSESHIVWQDFREGQYQVYYKLGHGYGTTWDDDERLVNTLYETKLPSLSFSGEWLHTVWQDDRDGNYEIYCKNKYIESVPASQFSITPGALNLDTVYVDGYRIDSLQVHNDGFNSLIINSIFTEPPFSLSLNCTDWSNTIKNIVVPGNPVGKKTIYARFHGIQPGWYSDSISIAIDDTLYLVTIEGTCKESTGFINEAECFSTFVYPNPASRQLTVGSSQPAVGGRRSAVRLSIVDLYGQEIKAFDNITSFPYQVDISYLPHGLYFLKMMKDGKVGSVKFLKIAE